MTIDRRESLRRFGQFVTGASGQEPTGGGAPPNDRLAPVLELVNVPEFEAMARLVLSGKQYGRVSGGQRRSFDKMTFRQRLMVYASDLDLTTPLFGHDMFAPIIVGPVSGQRALHPEGEVATARGASDGKAVMVATGDSPVDEVVAASQQPVWYQVYADASGASDDASRAVDAGCQAVCVTLAVSEGGAPTAIDWDTLSSLSAAIDVPVLAKGIMSVDQARAALDAGVDGLVVSNHGGVVGGGQALPIDVLAEVSDAVAGAVPVLVDGSFRRGTDILKGLALGASAVMVARPPMWGLAAYGAEGVQTVLELFQTELARNMASSGRPKIAMIDRELVRLDQW
tara:strand:- start:320 stop:1342 length:1023 start_codon:yes stop_codon:yes gene_type:complete